MVGWSGIVPRIVGEIYAALKAADTASRLSGGNSQAVSPQAYLLATTGCEDEARSILTVLEETARYVPPYAIALGYLDLRRADTIFQRLERAYDAEMFISCSRRSIRNGIRTAASGVSKKS